MSDRWEWVEIIEPRTQEHMYANLTTGECVWDPPPGVKIKKTDDNQWWELFDQNTSRFYYYNATSQKTVWHRPQNCDIIPLAKLQTLKQNTEVRDDSHLKAAKTKVKREISTQTPDRQTAKSDHHHHRHQQQQQQHVRAQSVKANASMTQTSPYLSRKHRQHGSGRYKEDRCVNGERVHHKRRGSAPVQPQYVRKDSLESSSPIQRSTVESPRPRRHGSRDSSRGSDSSSSYHSAVSHGRSASYDTCPRSDSIDVVAYGKPCQSPSLRRTVDCNRPADGNRGDSYRGDSNHGDNGGTSTRKSRHKNVVDNQSPFYDSGTYSRGSCDSVTQSHSRSSLESAQSQTLPHRSTIAAVDNISSHHRHGYESSHSRSSYDSSPQSRGSIDNMPPFINTEDFPPPTFTPADINRGFPFPSAVAGDMILQQQQQKPKPRAFPRTNPTYLKKRGETGSSGGGGGGGGTFQRRGTIDSQYETGTTETQTIENSPVSTTTNTTTNLDSSEFNNDNNLNLYRQESDSDSSHHRGAIYHDSLYHERSDSQTSQTSLSRTMRDQSDSHSSQGSLRNLPDSHSSHGSLRGLGGSDAVAVGSPSSQGSLRYTAGSGGVVMTTDDEQLSSRPSSQRSFHSSPRPDRKITSSPHQSLDSNSSDTNNPAAVAAAAALAGHHLDDTPRNHYSHETMPNYSRPNKIKYSRSESVNYPPQQQQQQQQQSSPAAHRMIGYHHPASRGSATVDPSYARSTSKHHNEYDLHIYQELDISGLQEPGLNTSYQADLPGGDISFRSEGIDTRQFEDSSDSNVFIPASPHPMSRAIDPPPQLDLHHNSLRRKRLTESDSATPLLEKSTSLQAELAQQRPLSMVVASHSEANIMCPGTNSLQRGGQRHATVPGALSSSNLSKKPGSDSDIESYAQMYLNTHKTGLFGKKMSIHHMLSWTKEPIQKPMLRTNDKNVKKDACEVFKMIQMYMADRKTKSTSQQVAWEIVTKGWSSPFLRDELFIQLCRQTTDNIKDDSLQRGWELLGICLAFFPPSVKFHSYLEGYIYRHLDPICDTERVPVSHFALYCQKKLERAAKLGAKKGLRPPTLEEVEQAKRGIFHPSMFNSTLEEVMTLQYHRMPECRLPWIQTMLSEEVLRLDGAQTEGIFRVPGDIDEVNVLKVQCDQWIQPEDLPDPHIPASLLKLWFRELYEPVIPADVYEQCVENYADPDAAIDIVHGLPEINKLVLCYLIRFLQVFAAPENAAVTKMDINNLAMVMAPNCLRCESDDPKIIFENTRKEMAFVRTLIQSLDTSFMEGII